MAQKFNFFIDQGSTFKALITVFDINNNVFDLTDHDLTGQIRRLYTSNTSIVDFTFEVETPASGQFMISLTADETANIASGSYVYDVLMTNDSDEVFRIVEGVVDVKPRVTR